MNLQDRYDKADRKVIEDIAKYGWCDMSIFPTRGDPPESMPFNYTVGLAELNHPDLLLMGMSNDQAHHVMHSAVAYIEKGNRFTPDTFSDQVLEGLRVAIIEIFDPLNDDYQMSMVNRLYGEVHGLQIIWPDTDDRFPWEPDFEEKFKGRQIMLGPWRGV